MSRVLRRTPVDDTLVKLKLDVSILNAIIKYIRCDYPSPEQIRMVERFVSMLDFKSYEYDNALHDRLSIIRILVDLYNDGVFDENLLMTTLNEKSPTYIELVKDVGIIKNQLSQKECDMIFKAVESRVHSYTIYRNRSKLSSLLDRFNADSFDVNYYELINELKEVMNTLLIDLQETSGRKTGILRKFSFSNKEAMSMLGNVLSKSKMPGAVLQTGMRQLNAVLSPGFRPTRLYTIIGGSGRFKSGTLLNLADQIRLFNPQIIPYENGIQKTILFVTLENTIEETLVRLYDMYSDLNDTFEDKSLEEVIQIFKENGRINLGSHDGIDIDMMYAGNLEINCRDIKAEIERLLREENKEVITVIVDYIKRVQSIHPNNGDERTRISYVSKELKNLATEFQISVITAMQLNREGNAILDAAIRENKSDVARFVGMSSIGNAWDIVEESDWVGLINLELQVSTKRLFLTIKSLKQRFKAKGKDGSMVADYFNHPFINNKNIRLMPDVDLPETVSIISLASDLQSIDETQFDDDNQRRRPTIQDLSKGTVMQALGGSLKSVI